MKLIIAEKPSLGRNIVAGIESVSDSKMRKCNGYYDGCGYIVTWAFGHLFSLADVESYSENKDTKPRWTMENLPCFPKQFKFELKKVEGGRVDAGVARQFELISSLCNREDVDTIINAGDADREGEIIVRLCVSHALKSKKQFKRLWLPDQTPQTVAKALTEMKDESEYENLANEGFARTYIDWLYGVNFTRYATLRCGSLLRVGRVIVPIVRAIYDRDMAIKNFVPGKYFAIVSREETNGEIVELTSKKKFSDKEANSALELCKKYNSADAVVTSVKNKKDKLAPGKLYSLSKLQNVLGKKYKISMAQSLEIVQGLYEKGYLTYPRTNSEYLATAEKDKIKQIIANCRNLGYPLEFKDSKTIFDDAKIESHSALTPTYKIPSKSQLTEDEFKVYSTVFRRFVAVFCSADCIISKTEITIRVGDYEDFVLKGMTILEKGWTQYDDYLQKDKILPKLSKGDLVNHNFKPLEKETTPPKHYTIETLNNYLKNPFREERSAADGSDESAAYMDSVGANDMEEYKAMFDGVELGTEATRTGIIDNARKSKYIDLKKDVYHILPDGIFLIESLKHLDIGMDKYKTCRMGQALKKIFRGEISVSDGISLAEEEISSVFDKASSPDTSESDTGFFGDVIGICPVCGSEVKRYKRSYGCSGYKDGCKFSISMFICSRAISKQNASLLLGEGETPVINGFISAKSGRSFDAKLKLEDGRVILSFDGIPKSTSSNRLENSNKAPRPTGSSDRQNPWGDEDINDILNNFDSLKPLTYPKENS